MFKAFFVFRLLLAPSFMEKSMCSDAVIICLPFFTKLVAV